MKDFKRTLVTAALPYANGNVHIGHLAGVYIPADIYVRYLRKRGEDVMYICGSDEHGVPITIKAKNEGITPQDVVDKYHGINKKAFEDFGISFDIYSRTSSEMHKKTSSEFFTNLYEKGCFVEKTNSQLYDEKANQFLADRYVTGTCPHCKNDNAYGDQCEACGTSLNATDLIDPRSSITGNVPVLKETKHWYLPLDKYQEFLEKWILEDHKEWKPNVYGQCKSWLENGLAPRAVTRDLDWGVQVPVEGADGKVLYVWFDAPIGYISATKEHTDDWEKYWKDEDTKMVHFIGKDNIVFHCIIFPAMLKADGSYILPENVPANEFLNLEGDKISTSRNWAVWLDEYLNDFKDKQDVLRYVLTANAPEAKDNDFTWNDFQTRNNNELVAVLGNFTNRALVLTHKYFDGKVPAMGELNEEEQKMFEELKHYKQNVEKSLERYRFKEALSEAMRFARLGNKYLTETEPWKLFKTEPKRVETILNICLQITANLAGVLEPFLPFTSKRLLDILNIEDVKWEQIGESVLSEGHDIEKPQYLFTKIEDKEIEVQKQKLVDAKEASRKANRTVKPAKENIAFEDFTKLDIRSGEILTAEKVAKTKKLLKLTVDTGIDQRTVVSGIAEHYKPEEIVGKKVSIIVNLAPVKLKGILSEGMILMAENSDGKLMFVSPDSETENGAEIK